MMKESRSGVDKVDRGEVLSTPTSLGHRFRLGVFCSLLIEQVALQGSCLAVAGT